MKPEKENRKEMTKRIRASLFESRNLPDVGIVDLLCPCLLVRLSHFLREARDEAFDAGQNLLHDLRILGCHIVALILIYLEL